MTSLIHIVIGKSEQKTIEYLQNEHCAKEETLPERT